MRNRLLLVTMTLLLTACAQSPDSGTPSALPTNPTSPAATGSSDKGDASAYVVSTDMSTKPTIEIAPGAGNVTELIVKDIVEGTGTAVQATDTLTVHYVGIGALSRQQFEASWDAGTTATFPLNGVIAGWQQGMLGMKVGGRRLLVIPGELAYPDGGPGIQPGETLIFIIDLISVP